MKALLTCEADIAVAKRRTERTFMLLMMIGFACASAL